MKIKVRVQPNSGRQEIQKLPDGTMKIYLKKQPEDGKANEELEKFLKKEWKKAVKVVGGFTSRNKTIELAE